MLPHGEICRAAFHAAVVTSTSLMAIQCFQRCFSLSPDEEMADAQPIDQPIPYASHDGGAHLHVLAAMPNILFMESGLGQGQLVDGCYLLPEEPGLGTVHH